VEGVEKLLLVLLLPLLLLYAAEGGGGGTELEFRTGGGAVYCLCELEAGREWPPEPTMVGMLLLLWPPWCCGCSSVT
jgi:hypothetical protein